MLAQRVMTGLILAVLTVGIALTGPAWLWAVYAGVGVLIGAHEWARLAKCNATQTWSFVAVAGGIMILSSGLAWLIPDVWRAIQVGWLALSLVFWLAVAPLWLYLEWRPGQKVLMLSTGLIVLIPMWMAAIMLQASAKALLFAVGVVAVADTSAYFCGRAWGRTKLAPRISPGKTWEGVLGAYVGVVLLAVGCYALAMDRSLPMNVFALAFFACMLASLSIEGDLFESWLKRQAGMKDSGNILPGHGGLLDRLDGLTASLPLAALFLARSGGG
jgi:phosphatidate cytidylyltransferase